MAANTEVGWTITILPDGTILAGYTANFWWGCQKVSPGCALCYAEAWSNRWGKQIWGPAATTEREYKKGIWKELPKWNEKAGNSGIRRKVFVQSMADFYEDHSMVKEWRAEALNLMLDCEHLDFLILTKRPENILSSTTEAGEWLLKEGKRKNGVRLLQWMKHGVDFAPKNFWMGTTVENQDQAEKRIPHLRSVPARIRFLSVEPMISPVYLDRIPDALYGKTWPDTTRGSGGAGGQMITTDPGDVHWVICGGESGQGARPMDLDWARYLRDQCQLANVPFFFKQLGSVLAKGGKGTDTAEIPADLQIREFPV